ncbi:MAG: hypothetical protein M0035_16490 [Actinomycetota bacterium]|nr:hypothetical protein [Actinomycetota bacterium]
MRQVLRFLAIVVVVSGLASAGSLLASAGRTEMRAHPVRLSEPTTLPPVTTATLPPLPTTILATIPTRTTLAPQPGRWSYSTLPALALPGREEVEGVRSSCVSRTFCMVIGASYDPATNSSSSGFTAVWNGERWQLSGPFSEAVKTDSATGSVTYASPRGISCTSARFCMAVGHVEPSGVCDSGAVPAPTPPTSSTPLRGGCQPPSATPLVSLWDGSTWSPLGLPTQTPDISLRGVSCVSTSFCSVVGRTGQSVSAPTRPLAAIWNGATWSDTVLSSAGGGSLRSVSCPSASFCQAVGFDGSGPGTLYAGWDGTRWSLEQSPQGLVGGLLGVSCTSRLSCMAVSTLSEVSPGSYQRPARWAMFSAIWSGITWMPVHGSTSSGYQPNLREISCPSATACLAIGYMQGADGIVGLIEAWDGTTWTQLSPPATVSPPWEFEGGSCAPGPSCLIFAQNDGTTTQAFLATQ